jgi:hypothetical protein
MDEANGRSEIVIGACICHNVNLFLIFVAYIQSVMHFAARV